MRNLKLIIVLSIFNLLIVKGQIGTEFWFAAPDVSFDHFNNSIPLNLHITALYTTHVTISRPADPTFIPVEFNLAPQQTQSVRLDALLTVNQIEVYARDISAGNFKQNKGFLIKAYPGEITAYYELEGASNTDIIALKSANALGKSFWVSTQRKYKNHGYSDDFSGFVVVATDDNTIVTINPNGNNLQFHGVAPFNVTLNKGQAIAVRAAGQAPAQHIFGIRVTSTKNIAITIFDDSMQIDDGGGNWDIFADQIVPVKLVGYEYIVLKGNVQDQVANTKDGEAIFITPTLDNTDIYIDGVFAGNIPLAGGYYSYVIKNLATHVRASKPVYVNHITGYSTLAAGARELGGAILPTIDGCTGSHSVTVKRTPAVGFVFFNNLMVRNDTVTGSPTRNKAIYNFTYSINGGAPIPINPNHFTYIMDSAFAVYDRTIAGGAAYYNSVIDGDILRVDNNIARFHLGVMQGKQSPGCKYGYFSDYAENGADVGIGGFTQGESGIFCNLNPIQIVAGGGTTYKWYAPFQPSLVDKLDYDTAAAPYFFPDSTGIYYFNVIITGECYARDTLETEIIVLEAAASSFTFSSDEGCSPFAPILTNNSDTVIGVTQIWTIVTAATGSYQINQDTIPRSFALELPENHTDTIQVHTIKLIVKGISNSCPTTKSKDITVKPQIDAGFTASDTVGCHPLVVNFTNTSTGHTDSTNYLWNFGNNTQSFEVDPSYTYNNFSFNDTVFIAKLLAESPFGCKDSTQKNIRIFPRIRASMAIETSASCSPLDIKINPGNSKGVDTFYWHIDYAYGDSLYTTQSYAPIYLYHVDTSIAGPDTLLINLRTENKFGCADTFPEQRIIVYPEVHAGFIADKDSICDSDSITFTNNSIGYKLFYDWDFDDGTIYQDTTGFVPKKAFFNRNADSSITYNVRLNTISGYFCMDSYDTIITVHPYIKANFGLTYSTNCTPLNAQFSDLSIRTHTYEWDFGDGQDTTYTTPVASFWHQYWNNSSTNDTIYPISLVTRNNEGCTDTLNRNLLVYPNIVSSFNLTDAAGCSPRVVTFNNNSTGGLLSYLWNFGNSTTGTNSAPTFIKNYTNLSQHDTTYYVSLTASNAFGCDSISYDSVKVLASIDADFNLPLTDSCSPFQLIPQNLSSSGAIVKDWDLIGYSPAVPTMHGDNPAIPILENLSTITDTVDLRLIAYGANDAPHLACADTHTIRVFLYPELNVDFTLVDALPQCQPFRSQLINNSNIKPTTIFQWRLDGNHYSSLTTPVNLNVSNFTSDSAVHYLKLTGITQFGCVDTISKSFTVYPLVDAKFTLDKPAICSSDSILIDRTLSRGGIQIYEWDYDTGEPIDLNSDSVFYHPFTNLGSSPDTLNVTLRVSYNVCDSSWTQPLIVYPYIDAGFNITGSPVCYPQPTDFVSTSTNATYFSYNFGDGTGATSANVTHKFENFSNTDSVTYYPKLTVRSLYNCIDTITHPVTIYAKPEAEFTFPYKTVDCSPFDAYMEDISIPSSGLTYLWVFPDATTSTLQNVTKTFENNTSNIIEESVTLIITSNKGCKDTAIHQLSVYPYVDANFTPSDPQNCSPFNVQFIGTPVNVNKLYWYIQEQGDPNEVAFSTIASPSYRFENETPDNKIFNIKFKAYSVYNCVDSSMTMVTVFPSPGAEFIPYPILQDYDYTDDQTTVTFVNETRFQDNWAYIWTYGDGNSNSETAGTFDYTYGNQFWGDLSNSSRVHVKLLAWNTENEQCRDSVMHDIIIKPPLPQIDLADDIAACVPFTVDFSAYTKYIYEDQFMWDFGVPGATSTEEEPTYTYTESGVYTAKLIVRGDGGTNWDYKIIRVYPQPEVDFAFNDSIVYDSSQTNGYDEINFYNETILANNYEWYFDAATFFYGGQPDSEEKNPVWHYSDTGTYYVVLVASSGEGCSDTMIHRTPIRVLGEGYIAFPTGFFVNPTGPEDEYGTDRPEGNRYLFYPANRGIADYKIEIYNRWGVLIFKTNDVNKGWNGYINGKPADQDVYIWRAKGRFTNGQPFDKSGDITLIRARID